jgi:hypothetical protein
MTLTPSMLAISLCSFPRLAKSFACASFVATSTRECRFSLAIAACPQPLRALIIEFAVQEPNHIRGMDAPTMSLRAQTITGPRARAA